LIKKLGAFVIIRALNLLILYLFLSHRCINP